MKRDTISQAFFSQHDSDDDDHDNSDSKDSDEADDEGAVVDSTFDSQETNFFDADVSEIERAMIDADVSQIILGAFAMPQRVDSSPPPSPVFDKAK